jgi:hypothetical protein
MRRRTLHRITFGLAIVAMTGWAIVFSLACLLFLIAIFPGGL